MARRAKRVDQALERWLDQGLVSPEQAAALRMEEEAHHARATRRWGQLLMASLGAFALLMAAILFAERSWEELADGARTAVLLGGGVLVYLAGIGVFRRAAWRYSGILLQTGGLGVILFALAYSVNAWPDGTVWAVAMGLLAFAIPAALGPWSFREGVIMSGVHTALSFGYLAVFLDRTFGLDFDAIAWILDGAAVVAVAVFWVAIRRWPAEYTDRALVAFAVSMWAGLVLALVTGVGPLDMEENAVLAMDVWMLLIVGITLWGIHLSPSEFRRDAYETNLALCVAVGGLLAMFTAGETWNLDAAGAAVAGAMVGGAGVAYGLRRDAHQVLVVSALVILLATWIFAIDQAGAMGGVVALLLSAAVLFWISTRIRAEAEPERGPTAGDR
ncbi:MAG TPA: DUF2157 domain-containing protein [Longimicrobiales bacterium]|nr:DUF2157 domain-containing protein [Longimicrobiales bacterium]